MDVCPSVLKEELLDPKEGGDRVFIDKRPWSSAEFTVAVTVWFAHYSVYPDRDYHQTTHQRSLFSPSDHTVISPYLVLAFFMNFVDPPSKAVLQ
jgi:hypothetical protein